MTEPGNSPLSDAPSDLFAELAACDEMLASTRPILRHLLVLGENLLLSEEIVARVRGMVTDIGLQLTRAMAQAGGQDAEPGYEAEPSPELLASLLNHPELLRHLHALAVEAQLAEFFRVRAGLDPVLAPMLQNMIASTDPQMSAWAMAVLAAQARFVQSQRRMELPLRELPRNLHEAVLNEFRRHASDQEGAPVEKVLLALRDGYDESSSRLALLSKLIGALEAGPASALSIEQGGVAFFSSALAIGSKQARDTAILATDVTQSMRLSLMLRCAGLSPQAIATQLLTLHPAAAVPAWLADLSVEQAGSLLAPPAAPGGRD